MSIENDAYAAGIIDGEGSIGVTNKNQGSYHLMCQVSMRNPEIPTWLYLNYGGNIGTFKQGIHSYSNRPAVLTKWHINGTEAQEFIGQIRQYLIEKRDRADLALSFPASKKGVKAEIDIQEVVYERMRVLQSLKNGRDKLGN